MRLVKYLPFEQAHRLFLLSSPVTFRLYSAGVKNMRSTLLKYLPFKTYRLLLLSPHVTLLSLKLGKIWCSDITIVAWCYGVN